MKTITVTVPDKVDHFAVATTLLELVESGSSQHALHFEGGTWVNPTKITHVRLGVSVELHEEAPCASPAP